MSDASPAGTAAPRGWRSFAAALLLLNASLGFQNVWPTPGIMWQGTLSVDFAAAIVVFAILAHRGVRLGTTALRAIGILWVVLIVGHYADVTASAVFGRPINLYWDSRHLSNVGAMLATVASWWIVLAVVAAFVIVPLALYWPSRWALGRLWEGLQARGARRVMVLATIPVFLLYAFGHRDEDNPVPKPLVPPVTVAYAAQVRTYVREALRGATIVPPSPPMLSDLSRVAGADVFVIFIESYGATSYDRVDLRGTLDPVRQRFAADVAATGRRVVSGFVTSPTFGGSSWLAHITLLSGLEVRDEDTNLALMAQQRETLVSTFRRHGYRTIALMPGLQQVWPEGSFYNFDAVYRGNELDYRGPDFGWWSVPDQFSIARLDDREVAARSRAPVFVFFPTISTHTPFGPLAPYQPDWPRLLTTKPYDDAALARAYDDEPDWLNLGPGYARAVQYDLNSIAGYLSLRRDRDFVMILLGDHQPPSAVSGEGVRWDVPVHIVASRASVLDRLIGRGFREGMVPAPAALAPMQTLTTILLDAFGDVASE